MRIGAYFLAVVPAQAGTQRLAAQESHWAPACAGATVGESRGVS